jgi:chaperonin cofactor prefoldin
MSKVWNMTKTEKITPLYDDNSELENRVQKIEDKLGTIENKLDKLVDVLSSRQHELTREMKEK